jgi:hypothetical protein
MKGTTMKNGAILLGILLILSTGCGKAPSDDKHPPVTPRAVAAPQKSLDGIYKPEGKEHGGFEIKGNKMISGDSAAGTKAEVSFQQKGGYIYVKPIIPEGENIESNIVVVYKITDNGLMISHVENATTGERIDAEIPKQVYIKQ